MSEEAVSDKAGKVRMSVDLRRGQWEDIEKMASECGITPEKLFDVAMTLFQWSVQQSKRGRKLGSLDPSDIKSLELIEMPALEAARKSALT